MRRIWLLLFPIVVGLIACDMPSLNGGMSGEGQCNQKVLRVHASSLTLEMTANCAYEKECDVKFYFYVKGLPDSLKGMCFGGGVEWKFESFDTSMVAKDWESYPISLTPENHAKFSLFDINNVEKKYDIDLSGVANSFTVRGDSVDVNVMKSCRITVISTPQNIEIYGNIYPESVFTFSAKESLRSWFGYDCSWHSQGPFEKDDLNIHAEIYWKK